MTSSSNSPERAFTLVEIMIVVAVIALLAAIAVPAFLRARKRSQAATVRNELRLVDSAVEQYAIETNKKTGDAVNFGDWRKHVKPDTRLYRTGQDIFGNNYGNQEVADLPKVPQQTWDSLSDVTDDEFWAPFKRKNGNGTVTNTP